MTKFFKIIIYKFSLIIIYLLTTINSYAACEKSDINYYLEKGFTPEQITALCSDKIESKSKVDIYEAFSDEYASETDEEYVRKMRIERQVFFKSALGAQNIKIQRDKLSFQTYECARDGLAKPGSDFNKEGCATVLNIVNLANVEVSEKEFKEKVVFGNRSILVRGDVKSRIVGGMEGLSKYDAGVLNKKILARLGQHKGEVLIPLKTGLNFSYALETFKEIVSFHKDLAKNKMSRKDLGGKLEFKKEVDKQDEYIIDTGKKKLKLSNEEDDAIDGNLVFDDLKTSIPRETNNDQIPENVFD
tara:strand:+ start:293 stop:1198 length:906 start_codon:yes stop_codon:yes gene_type:complete